MKKCFYALLCAMIVLATGGCSSSKSPEDTLEALYNYSHKIVIDYGGYYDDYRSLDGKCYNRDGVETVCGRIISDIDDNYSMSIMNPKDSEETISFSIKGDELLSISYSNDKGGYVERFVDNTKLSHLYDQDYCSYYFEGNAKENDTVCDSTAKKDAEKMRDSFEEMLSAINISKNDFKEFALWYSENEGNSFITKLKKEKENQKELTPSEVEAILKKEYTIHTADNGIVIEDDIKYDSIMFLTNKSDIVFKTKTFDNLALYLYNDGKIITASDDLKCAYSLNDEIILKNYKCSTDQVHNSTLIQVSFNNILEKNGITLNELKNFFENYGK